jgi:hypothetical protein
VHNDSSEPKKIPNSTILLKCTLIYSSQNISFITVLLEETFIFASLRIFRRCGRLRLISHLLRAMMERINMETDKQLVLKPETEVSVSFRTGAIQYRSAYFEWQTQGRTSHCSNNTPQRRTERTSSSTTDKHAPEIRTKSS